MAIPSKTGAGEEKRVRVSFSDSINLIRDQVHWSPKGVSLLTKWPFRVGAEVEFAFDHQGERHCCTGVVVACHSLRRPTGFYETVLFFVETPCSKLVKAACDCQLAQEDGVQDETELTSHSRVMDENSNDHTGASCRSRPVHARH
jgi:hypothetical protein